MDQGEAPGRDQPTGGNSNINFEDVNLDTDPTRGGRRDGANGLDPRAMQFVDNLVALGAAVWVASAGTGRGEFHRPLGWQKLTGEDNQCRLNGFHPGMALCVNTGGVIAVGDVDPRNGGDVESVRKRLADLKVRIFAEVITPSGGRHSYISGHVDLPTVHGKLREFPGVDVQSFGGNVFLPGTQRPKYGGAGYTIVFDDLDALD